MVLQRSNAACPWLPTIRAGLRDSSLLPSLGFCHGKLPARQLFPCRGTRPDQGMSQHQALLGPPGRNYCCCHPDQPSRTLHHLIVVKIWPSCSVLCVEHGIVKLGWGKNKFQQYTLAYFGSVLQQEGMTALTESIDFTIHFVKMPGI